MNFTSFSPREIVELGKGVNGEDEIPNRKGDEVDKHPSNVDDLEGRDEDKETGKTEYTSEKDERNRVSERSGRVEDVVDDQGVGEADGDG